MAVQKNKQTQKTVTIYVEDLEYIKETLNRINETIVGDDKYGRKGLVEIVEKHELYIQNDKQFKSKLIGASIVLGGIWTFFMKFWDRMF